MARDVEELLGEFAVLSQALPKGGVKERTIKHHITTIPENSPAYKRFAHHHSARIGREGSRNT